MPVQNYLRDIPALGSGMADTAIAMNQMRNRNALTEDARQRTEAYAQQNSLLQQRFDAQQGDEARKQQMLERYAQMVGVARTGNPQAKAQFVQMQAQQHPEFAQTLYAKLPPDQAFDGMMADMATQLGVPQEQPKQQTLYSTEQGYLPADQAVGKMPYRARPVGGAAAAPGGPKFRTLSGDEAKAAGFPEGAVVQTNTQTGENKVLYKQPPANANIASKQGAVRTLDYVVSTFTQHLPNVKTGGPLGVRGYMSQATDYQDSKRFENLREQLSTELRTIFRIPGEGALSDREQAQYGLQLPDIRYSRENNLAILTDIRNRARLRMEAAPAGEPESDVVDFNDY